MQINTSCEMFIVHRTHVSDDFALSVDMFNLLWNYVLTDSVYSMCWGRTEGKYCIRAKNKLVNVCAECRYYCRWHPLVVVVGQSTQFYYHKKLFEDFSIHSAQPIPRSLSISLCGVWNSNGKVGRGKKKFHVWVWVTMTVCRTLQLITFSIRPLFRGHSI